MLAMTLASHFNYMVFFVRPSHQHYLLVPLLCELDRHGLSDAGARAAYLDHPLGDGGPFIRIVGR